MQDIRQTVISQFANSPVMLELIDNFNSYFDPTQVSDDIYNLVWNVATARGYGLDVWGRIVGVSRVLSVAAQNYLGFEGVTTNPTTPFNVGPWYAGGGLTTNFSLTDDAFRTLIYAKALANIWDGSIPALNKILLTLFPGRGNCYVAVGNLSLVYTFTFTLSNVEAAIVGASGVLPAPAGVAVSVSHP